MSDPRGDGPGGAAIASETQLARWNRLGLVATAVIVLAIPLAYVKARLATPPPVREEQAVYVGRDTCRECHRSADEKWSGSPHDLAMQEATDQTVLGDFDDATYTAFGVTSRFYRQDGAFWVHTEGPGGVMADYEIAYVFGVWPLQQYLIQFPGGRLQSLTLAWDVERKRWYHLYPEARIPPDDWLHWTRGAQTWNGMCAECHSTRLLKGYAPETDAYTTTWSEIDVSCEACHGPASRHVAWARLPAMARPAADDYRLVISTRGASAREQVELCAPCHSRRFLLQDYRHEPGTDLLDHLVPALLAEGLYYPDGQIQDEVYVYGSFVQSKMYRHNVRCTDCHDPHSTRRHQEGNALCRRCHRGDVYETSDHHFHKAVHQGQPSPGWLCTSCHMPERVYMGIDWRADHSLRVPRPDLSLTIGTPNACGQAGCHADKPAAWAADAYTRWYGQARRPHYGTVLTAARQGRPEARADLLRLTQDRLYATIVRATAVSLLERYPGEDTREVLLRALEDEESIVRRAALDQAAMLPPVERLRRVLPLLRDPVKGVRVQAARLLAETPGRRFAADDEAAFREALAEFEGAMRYQLDFASAGYNLGNLYAALGRPEDAERSYRTSLRIDPLFVRTRVNYATLLSGLGRNPDAEAQLRAALEIEPRSPEVPYNLGLLLAEMGRLPEAVSFLEQAARLLPPFARAHYNLGLAYRQQGQAAAAEASLRRALDLDPSNGDFLFALADFLLRQGRLDEARGIVEVWIDRRPDDPRAQRLLTAIEQATAPGPR